MYKTVRHGENSLQYKILAQQEEGLAGVKRRKSPKTFIVKVVAIVTLLIILIMVSAFLVPLLLAKDFIAVTGTFQKFSVSTLRRSHSGNNVVVIAKKPYGWNALHPTMPPRVSNASQTPNKDPEKLPPGTKPPHTTIEPTTATPSTARTTATTPTTTPTTATTRMSTETTTAAILLKEPNSFHLPKYKLTTNPASERTIASRENQWGWAKFPPTKTDIQKGTAEGELVSSKLEPILLKADKDFYFGSSNIDKTDEEMILPLFVVAGFVIVAVIICFVVSKILCRRTSSEKETAESKEDKRKLLKNAVSSDHDEE